MVFSPSCRAPVMSNMWRANAFDMRPTVLPFTTSEAKVSTDESTSVHVSVCFLLSATPVVSDHRQRDMKRLVRAFSPLYGSSMNPASWSALCTSNGNVTSTLFPHRSGQSALRISSSRHLSVQGPSSTIVFMT